MHAAMSAVPGLTDVSPLTLAMRFVGEIAERPGGATHPAIVWAHELCRLRDTSDEVPWCSSFVNLVCWLLRLPRSQSAAARSWLGIGVAVPLDDAVPGWDVVVLSRGTNPSAGHVGFYAGQERAGAGNSTVIICGGNQGDGVSVQAFPASRVVGIRRLPW